MFEEILNEQEEYAEFDDTVDTDISDTEIQEVQDNSISNVQVGREWSNMDQVPVKKISCYVPKKLYDAIREIESQVNKKFGCKNEFSIFIHGEFDEEGDLIVSDNFYIPKQVVGPASVDYKEAPEEYYNGCLHKHPDGVGSFSGTDDRYINSNFEFSLLYVNKEIKMGIINIKYFENRRIQVGLNIHTEEYSSISVDIDNIQRHVSKPKKITPISPLANTPPLFLPGSNDAKKTRTDQQLILPSFYSGLGAGADVEDNGNEYEIDDDPYDINNYPL